jgi:hypothetical protein
MSEGFLRRNMVAYPLLEFTGVWKAPFFLARPHDLATDAHNEHATASRDKRHATQIILECGEEFLCHPGGT